MTGRLGLLPHRPTLAPSLPTCLSLSVGENLTADPRHAGYGVGDDWSRSEGAQDLCLSPEGGGADLQVEGEPCSGATARGTQDGGWRLEGLSGECGLQALVHWLSIQG